MKTSYKIYAMLLLAAVVTTSCKVSKDVDTPTDAYPEKYRGAAAASANDTTSAADIQWKAFFAEKDLVKLIDSAVARNYDLQLAQKNIEIAQLRLSQSKWNNVPQVNLGVTATSSRPSDNSLNGISLNQFLDKKHIEDYTISAGLSWEADIWGKIKSQNKATLALYLQSEEARKALQTAIVANVAKGYYNLLMLDSQLKIAKENLALNDNTLVLIRLQFDSGQVNSLAVQQAEAQRLVAAQLVPQLQQNIAIQENALSILAGSFPSAKQRENILEGIELKKNLATGVPSVLVSKRPDVRSAQLALQQANARVGIAKTSLYPSLTITAAGGLNSFETSNWFNIPGSLFGAVAGGLTQPLLNSRKLRTQYKIAQTEREQSVLLFRKQVLVAVGEVSDALVQLEKLDDQQGIAQQRVETLQQATKNANMLFQNGMATYLEVIVAQGNILQSQLELASVKRQLLSANVELYRSLGGGWQ